MAVTLFNGDVEFGSRVFEIQQAHALGEALVVLWGGIWFALTGEARCRWLWLLLKLNLLLLERVVIEVSILIVVVHAHSGWEAPHLHDMVVGGQSRRRVCQHLFLPLPCNSVSPIALGEVSECAPIKVGFGNFRTGDWEIDWTGSR